MSDNKKIILDAIKNINDDREIAHQLLGHLRLIIENQPDAHVNLGHITSKYLESIQRGNDQLIKIAGILSKNKDEEEEIVSPDDIFDAIQNKSKNSKEPEPDVYIPQIDEESN